MKDRALSTLGLWVVVGLVIWVGGFFSVAEQAAFGLLALLVGAAQYEFHQLAARIPGVPRPRPSGIVAGFVLLFALFFLANERARANAVLTLGALLFGLHLLALLRRPGEVPTLLRRFPTLYGFAYIPFMLASLVAIARASPGSWRLRTTAPPPRASSSRAAAFSAPACASAAARRRRRRRSSRRQGCYSLGAASAAGAIATTSSWSVKSMPASTSASTSAPKSRDFASPMPGNSRSAARPPSAKTPTNPRSG